jgi:[protein-PII] uridylyltransferase
VPVLDPSAIDLAPGPEWCRAWSDRVDEALRAWFADGESRGVTVVALGGYARRELCPASDVDLLLLHSGADGTELSELVQRLCYPLWDAGLQVGHAVRTPAQAVQAAGERLDTATALTDRRLIAGERGLLDDLASRVGAWLRRNAATLLDELGAGDARRHARAGDRPGMLEPHLKDGAGGLRDLHSLRWAAAALLGEAGLDSLVNAHYLGAAMRRDLAAAGRTLLSARCALHLVLGAAGRPAGAELDRLRLDLQDEIAHRLGMADGDALLRDVGLATRTVAYVSERVRPQLAEDARRGRRWLRGAARRHRPSSGAGRMGPPGGARRMGHDAVDASAHSAVDASGSGGPEPLEDGLLLADGAVAIETGRSLAAEPSLGLRAVAAAARLGLWLHRHTAEHLRREVADLGGLPWDDRARAALLQTLRTGAGGLPALGDAGFTGLLVAHLPGWERIRGRRQRNPFHLYDLDTHLKQTVAEVVELARGGRTEREAALFEGLAEPDVLLLACFLHDIGKAWPGDHSIVGAELAAQWVHAMGFDKVWAERVEGLVRHHLLLPLVAQYRDLDDPDELRRVAELVPDVEDLDALYLLSLADARATGPAAHSPWKDGLLAELHARVRKLLHGAPGPVTPRPDDVATGVRAAAGPQAERFLSTVDDRYLVAAGAEQVLVHLRLATPPPAEGLLRADVRPGPADATATVSVAGADRRGLMADCAGVLAAAGGAVLDARAFLTSAGVALAWFVVRPPAEGLGGGLTADLARAAAGDLDVAAAVAARERRRDARPRPLAAPVPVEVRFDPGGNTPRIEARGPDSPGLLYRLAAALAAAGVDVGGARVATLGPEAHDVFFVRTELDPATRSALDRTLRAAIATL